MKYIKIISLFCLIGLIIIPMEVMADEDIIKKGDLHQKGSNMDSEEARVSIEEYVDLPNIHENTLIYSGTLSPDFDWVVVFPEVDEEDQMYVNDDGQFSIGTASNNLEAGEEITFYPTAAKHIDNLTQTIEIQPEKEGKAYIDNHADTNDVAEVILENTTIEWSDSKQTADFEVETTGDVEAPPFYALKNDGLDEDKKMEHISGDTFKAYLNVNSINPGDEVRVYLTGLGVTAIKETKVPEDLSIFNSDRSEKNQSEETDNEDNVSDSSNKEKAEQNKSNNTSETTDENNNSYSIILWIVGILLAVLLIIIVIVILKRQKNKK